MKNNSYFKGKLCNLFFVLLILFGYNQMLEKKDMKAELVASERELSDLEAKLEEAAKKGTEENVENFQDGTYEGTGQGFGGDIVVSITVEEGKITDAKVKSAQKEDAAYLDTAKQVLDQIVDRQTAKVDAISGATFSSKGIIEGAEEALSKAVK